MMLVWLLAVAPGCAHRTPAPAEALADPAARSDLSGAVRTALEAGANDLDVSVRRDAIAALLLADPAPGGGQWGQRGRFDPSEYVQRAVVDALAIRGAEPASRALLRSFVDDTGASPWVRGAAALALADAITAGRMPADEAALDRARIVAAGSTAAGGRRGALLLASARIGDASARLLLSEHLSEGDLPLELWFFEALGASGMDALTGPLVQALERAEPELQLAIATALLDLGAPAGERVLTAAVASGEDQALEALEYLAAARGAGADEALRAAASGNALVRDVAMLALFGRGQGEVRDVLRLLQAEDADVRMVAAQASGRRLRADPSMEGADRLRAGLRDTFPDAGPGLQLALIGALAGSRVESDRAALTALLDDESIRIRVATAAALAR